MPWTFQTRFPPNNSGETPSASEWRWRTSAKRYPDTEHAAAGAAMLQAIAATNGVLLECRLMPVSDKANPNELGHFEMPTEEGE